MIFREATLRDIPQMQIVRHSVRENILSDPGLVKGNDYKKFLRKRGKGWVCESQHILLGFAIADLTGCNIWALFIRPESEKRGIGKKLHQTMLDWYFSNTREKVWLGTAPHTRAANFYRKAGWKETGLHGEREIRFEMTWEEWESVR
jgi:GNAT superfamily N-acetyltransferase